MAINIRSFNQILGEMVRKIIADTPLNDINTGSVLLSILEAAAQVDYENNASILNVLELLNIDATRNNDLDQRGADSGLVRISAQRSTGFISIKDTHLNIDGTTFSKRSTGLYQVKTPPIASSTVIYVNDALVWSPTGNLFIGRGTASFEGPVPYTSIVNNGSFFTINLGSALQKDHLISDVVVDGQGTTDRLVAAGVSIYIPANNQNPIVEYRTLRNAVIPAGEDTATGINIVSILAGSRNNASINTITNFTSIPFTGATVFNTSTLSDGRDVETDDSFRERIKSYANTLARGTANAIISAIIGVSDSDDGKQVSSASITEPPVVGDPSILYIDDGSGFQPSFKGQSVDVLLSEASGNEEFLQLANYPLPRPQVINTVDGPYELTNGMSLRVLVDGIEESITFSTSQFLNISVATLSEVIIAINNQSSTFKATFTDTSTKMLLFPVNHAVELIQVSPLRSTDDSLLFANNVLKFPNNTYSYIRLYQNNTLLNEKQKSASLLTTTFSSWNITVTGNLVISVDGTPPQDRSFSGADFGGTPFASLTLDNWVTAFNAKYAGITVTATSSGRMHFVSNKDGSASALVIEGGTYFDKFFSGQETSAVGQNSNFQLNRQTGNLRILTDIVVGDMITAGTDDAKGIFISSETTTGNYNVSTDSNNRPAELLVTVDAKEVSPRFGIGLAIGNIITITDQGSNVMRLMSDSLSSFDAAQPHDFLYITSRGVGAWVDPANTGLYKIITKGEHTTASTDSYIEVKNVGIVPGVHVVQASKDMQVFKSDKYLQLWKGTFTATPPSATIQNIVDTINNSFVNVKASIFKTDSIKLTSTTEDEGSIALPVSVGNSTLLFASQQSEKVGNPSHIANRVSSKDAVSFFKMTEPTAEDADNVAGKNVWLDRVTYADSSGVLTSNAIPGIEGIDTYSEELQSTDSLNPLAVDYDDIVNNLDGNNKGHYRSIRDKLTGDKVGTQHALPRTLMDYSALDRFNLMRPVSINAEDSIVLILDQDSVAKTIDVKMSRTGRVNTSLPISNQSFSANDADNEPGITFASLQVWGKTANKTEFKDYAVWFRSRNWYVSGGATSGGGAMILRAREYGPHGDNYRFRVEYPTFPNQVNTVSHNTTPDYTLNTYAFGSGPVKATGVTAGDTIAVTSLGGDDYRLTFSNLGTNLATVVVGDIISMLVDSGISVSNRGTFRIKGVNNVLKYVDVYNPDGAVTGIGSPEVSTITTVADVVGTKTVSTISAVLAEAAITDDDFFTLNDSAGVVAVVYNRSGGVGTPSSYGANRILVVPLAGGEIAATVTALTSGVIAADPEFDSTYLGTTITVVNADNGALTQAVDGTSTTGFNFAVFTVGTASASIDGKYFILHDAAGSVAFWYDVTGITPQPLHGASRAVRISTVIAGDSANTTAIKTAVVVNGDAGFASATVLLNVITATDAANGDRPNIWTTGTVFGAITHSGGTNSGPETITIATSVLIFPLINTAVSNIVAKINADSKVLYAALVSGTNPIVKATRDEEYVPAGPTNYSLSLSYAHDPDPANLVNGYVRLYDGINWVRQFENTLPNFSLKTPIILQGIAPTAYAIENAPNHDSVDLGEFFKLVPITLNNVYHHFTQKALSQLPIVSDIAISSAIRKIQVKSKQLGSAGAIEIVGGNANNIELSIFGDGQVSPGATKDLLEVKTAAFPVTITKGDYVEIVNTRSTKRASKLKAGDSIDVFKGVGSNTEYRWNYKDTQFSPFVRFTIADQSVAYSRPAGTVWRWTHNDGGSYFDITAVVNGLSTFGPDDEIAAGVTDAANLQSELFTLGSVTTKQHFRLTVSGVPTQADYFTFQSASGVTFAVWFDVNNVGTAPTGATYIAATNQVEVDILSTNTEDQIISALSIKLLATPAFLTHFTGAQTQGANLDDVEVGDLLCAYNTFPAGWSSGNKAKVTGDTNVSGLPIINVNTTSKYIDVVNPDGVAMTNQAIGTGSVGVVPTPSIKWNLKHSAKTPLVKITVLTGVATATTTIQHGLKEGDTFTLTDNAVVPTTFLVVSVPSALSFTFVTATTNGDYFKGHTIRSSRAVTRYAIESIGFNSLYKLRWIDGNAPGFVDCGVAVDDMMFISGETFSSNNSGTFRILGVTNDSLIYQNEIAIEQLDTLVSFNNLDLPVSWTANLDQVIGAAGTFKNLNIGDWVKKKEDPETLYRQVIAKNTGSFDTATMITLGGNYQGTTSSSIGISFDQNSDVGKGAQLQGVDDIQIFEGDSARIDDLLFVDNIANANWFNSVNAGSFKITQVGSTADCRPFVRVSNASGATQSTRQISVNPIGYFLIEGAANTYRSLRRVEHTAIDVFNENRRQIFLTPATRAYKVSQTSGSKIIPVGKLNYSVDVTTGIDGYNYYTGLMRTVQRIIDGFEPDSITYPGRRAIGGVIETLPPLIKRISMTLQITANEGVNLNDIIDNVKSAIINYINQLGVSGDVILAEVIVRVMGIAGVEAVTVNSPLASTEGRIPVSDNERAFIEPQNISVA